MGAHPTVYVSTDVETDGPVPGCNSLLSIGSVAFNAQGQEFDSYSVNLDLLPGAVGEAKTMAWWQTQPEAWQACRTHTQPPEQAMPSYADWVDALPGNPVFVAYPAGFDFTFVYWYLHTFAGRCPFGFAALDLKTLAMALLGVEFRQVSKPRMPKRWFGPAPHTHIALDDAREQGQLLFAMLAELRGARE